MEEFILGAFRSIIRKGWIRVIGRRYTDSIEKIEINFHDILSSFLEFNTKQIPKKYI